MNHRQIEDVVERMVELAMSRDRAAEATREPPIDREAALVTIACRVAGELIGQVASETKDPRGYIEARIWCLAEDIVARAMLSAYSAKAFRIRPSEGAPR